MNNPLSNYQLADNDLGLFIDESGDTALRDPVNRQFVLGCAMVLGCDINNIQTKWRIVRRAITGNEGSPIHMRTHSGVIRDSAQNALVNFFDYADMARLAVSFVQDVNFDVRGRASKIVLRAVFDELLARQAELCSRVRVNSLTVVFEKSPLIKGISRLCEDLTLHEGDRSVPLKFVHLSKNICDVNLEIADVISHTMSASVRLQPSPPLIAERFVSIFQPKNQAPGLARELTGLFSIKKTSFSNGSV